VEEEGIKTRANTISESKLDECMSHIISNQSLLRHMENAHDKPGCGFIALQWQGAIHFLFEVPKKTQIKALKDLSRGRREIYDFHLMICNHL
jgi:hypothetical protein